MTNVPVRPKESAEASGKHRALNHLFQEYERARAERDAAEERVSQFAETIQLLIEGLSEKDKQEYQRRFDNIRLEHLVPYRGGEVYGNVIELFRKNANRNEWSVSEIQSALAEKGAAPADPKALYNTITYLANTGRLKRIARGRYIIRDLGVILEHEGSDDGTTRPTEQDN